MNKTIFAHTELVSPLPGFINIRRDGKGQHIISVRSRGQQYPAELAIAPELLENLAAELMAHLHGEPTAQPEAQAPAVVDGFADAFRAVWKQEVGGDMNTAGRDVALRVALEALSKPPVQGSQS